MKESRIVNLWIITLTISYLLPTSTNMKHFFKNCVLIEMEVNWEVQTASNEMFQNCRAPWCDDYYFNFAIFLSTYAWCLLSGGAGSGENDNAGVVMVSRCDPPAHWVWCNPWWGCLALLSVQCRSTGPSSQTITANFVYDGALYYTYYCLVKCKLNRKLLLVVVALDGLSVSKESHPNK